MDFTCAPTGVYSCIACISLLVFIIITVKKSFTSVFAGMSLFYLICSILCSCCIMSCISGLIHSQCLQQNTAIAWIIACLCSCCYIGGIIAGIKQIM
jgi:hypothetical protein